MLLIFELINNLLSPSLGIETYFLIQIGTLSNNSDNTE